MDYEVVIPAAAKDYNKVPYLLSTLHYLSPVPKAVHIIHDGGFVIEPNNRKFPISIAPSKVFSHHEKDVLDLDEKLAKHFRRPQWIYQQFLKLFQQVTKTDYYLIVDSDLMFNRDIRLFSDGNRPKFFLGNDQNHPPYFKYSQDMFGFGREHDYSFISEIMLMKKSVNHALLSEFHFHQQKTLTDPKQKRHHQERYVTLNLDENALDESILELYELTCQGATDGWIPADYELYGNFVHKVFPEKYVMEHIKTSMRGLYSPWSNEQLESYIEEMKGTDYDTFTAHTWI